MLRDFHTHTIYSDGGNTPEEMVLAAIDRGLECIGFSDHSYTFFDESYCMKLEAIPEYIAEIAGLKEKYKDKIEVLCGIEQDLYSDCSVDCYDYHIVSMHYIYADGEYLPVDESAEKQISMVEGHFGGDWYAAAEAYFGQLSNAKGADIIGHFDLFCKFNEKGRFFDENNPRYVAAWQKAVDKLLENNDLFEINTGAIARGYKTVPYPSASMVEYISRKGGKFILSSDSHSTETLAFEFEKYIDIL